MSSNIHDILFFTIEDDIPKPLPEASLFPPFLKLLKRDRKRNKHNGMMELAFVFWTCWYNSPFVKNYPEELVEKVVQSKVGLPKDWSPDVVIRQAQNFYRAEQNTVSMKILEEIRKTLFASEKMIEVIQKDLKKFTDEYDSFDVSFDMDLYEQVDSAERKEMENKNNFLEKRIETKMDKAIARLQKMVKLAEDIPDALFAITGLEKRVREERADKDSRRRGGIDHNEAEDPQFLEEDD